MGNVNIIRDRIFNRIVNELCKIKGLEFLTPEEYKKFEKEVKMLMTEEMDNLVLY
jgi:hypothetical protein